MSAQNPIFNRLNLLLGEETMERVLSKRVIIFGVGGAWVNDEFFHDGLKFIKHPVLSDKNHVDGCYYFKRSDRKPPLRPKI